MKLKRLTVLIAVIMTAVLLSGCGADEAVSVVQELAGRITGEEKQEETAKESSEESGVFYGYVEIPEDAVFIGGDSSYEEVRELLSEALEDMEPTVCIQNHVWFDTPDFYEMPYSTFWLEDFTARRFWGKRKGDKENSSFDIYEFRYYDLSGSEIREMKKEIDDAAEEIIGKVSSKEQSWENLRTVHDELCRLITYDQTQSEPHCHDLYGALVSHSAVCSGYACAFTHIMRELGYYCPLSYSDDHAWNRVGVPSYDEYIDITWDDTDMTDRNGDPYIDYSYFFLTREECESIDSHSIQGMDPYVEMSDGQAYNYYSHEGYLLQSYSEEAIKDMFQRQYDKKQNLLTVRFARDEDYQTAKSWQENDCEGFFPFLSSLGYYDMFCYWYNDNVRTVMIGLYPKE